MPCYDPRPEYEAEQCKRDLDARTAQLCALCALVEKAGGSVLIEAAGLSDWWLDHKLFDGKRSKADLLTGSMMK